MFCPRFFVLSLLTMGALELQTAVQLIKTHLTCFTCVSVDPAVGITAPVFPVIAMF